MAVGPTARLPADTAPTSSRLDRNPPAGRGAWVRNVPQSLARPESRLVLDGFEALPAALVELDRRRPRPPRDDDRARSPGARAGRADRRAVRESRGGRSPRSPGRTARRQARGPRRSHPFDVWLEAAGGMAR